MAYFPDCQSEAGWQKMSFIYILLLSFFCLLSDLLVLTLLSTRDENSWICKNSIDLDEVAHTEPPHLDLHCLPFSRLILNMIYSLDLTFFQNLQTKILSSFKVIWKCILSFRVLSSSPTSEPQGQTQLTFPDIIIFPPLKAIFKFSIFRKCTKPDILIRNQPDPQTIGKIHCQEIYF